MSVYSSFKSIIGVVTAEENRNIIRLDGLRTEDLDSDFAKEWGTGRVFANMVRAWSKSHITIDAFFAPDLLYAMGKLYAKPKRIRTPRRSLEKAIVELSENTWLTSTKMKHPSILKLGNLDGLNLTLLKHQREFLDIYDSRTQQYRLNGYLLGAAPGSGKTINSIALSVCLESDITIYIVPKPSVERVWDATLGSLFKREQPYWTSAQNKPLEEGYRHYVFHYEQIERALEFFSNLRSRKKINIVIDECHNFNDIKSARTEMLVALHKAVDCKHSLWMSGTPVKAMGTEVIPLLRCIDPYFSESVEARFRKVFGVSTARGLDILANRMGFISFKVDKGLVVGNKIEPYRVDVRMENSAEYSLDKIRALMASYIKERMDYYRTNMASFLKQYFDCIKLHESTLKTATELQAFAQYRKYAATLHAGYDPEIHKLEPLYCNQYEKRNIIPGLPAHLKEDFKNSRSVYKYYHLKVQGEALGRILGRHRTMCNIDMARAMDNYSITEQFGSKDSYASNLSSIIDNSKKKTVIFTSYVEVVDVVHEMLSEKGYSPLRVYGDTNKDLAKIVEQFEKDPNLNPLIATFQSLSTAVPLVMANTAVMLNAPYRAHEHEQALSRVDRIGQTEVVCNYNVFLDTGNEPNISTRSSDIMEWSRDQVNAIMGTKATDTAAALESIGAEFDPESSHLALESVDIEPVVFAKQMSVGW